MAVLTMLVLAMAVLAMAVLTMAMGTMAILITVPAMAVLTFLAMVTMGLLALRPSSCMPYMHSRCTCAASLASM